MKSKPQQIDEVDDAILRCLRAQPRKLNNIISVTGLNYATGRKRLEKLQRYDYIVSPNFGYYTITTSGKNLLEARAVGVVAPDLKDAGLEGLIRLLPTEPHQAFFRLLVSGIIAKHCLFEQFNDGYPAFIIGGKTKAFKTSIAKVICILFRFDLTLIHKLFSATPGEFGIRRIPVRDGRFEPKPSSYFGEPFICLDEFDKQTSPDMKRVLLNYADGAREFPIEGIPVVNRCTALITLNTSGDMDSIRALGIPDPYIRRSIVISTDSLVGQLRDVDLVAKSVFDYMGSRNAPKIRLESLQARITKLSDLDFRLMRNLLMDNIIEGAESLVDTQPLEILTLGRAMILGNDIKEAIFQTVWDRLVCLETLGIAGEGWRKRIQEEWTKYQAIEQPAILEKLKEAELKEVERTIALEERKTELQKRKEDKTNEKLQFIAEREDVVGRLGKSIDSLKTISKTRLFETQARTLLEQSRYLQSRIEKANNHDELMSYTSPYNNLAREGTKLISQYNSWVSGQNVKNTSETDVKPKPLDIYQGQILNHSVIEVIEGPGYVDKDGWRVKLEKGILEIIKESQRFPILVCNSGCFKLGTKYAVRFEGVFHTPERIIIKVGSVQ